MRLGFALFARLSTHRVCEVFPSASYTQLNGESEPEVTIIFAAFVYGPKDMLDAILAAATVREYAAGRGAAVGGGDGLGDIVLPRPLREPIPEVLTWPGAG